MPMAGFVLHGENVRLSAALAMAQNGDVPYPPVLLSALFSDRSDDTPSASAISGCLRDFEWKRTHDYYVAPESMMPAMFGTGVHGLLERHGDENSAVGERESFMQANIEVPGHGALTVSGTVDHIDPLNGVVLDWKTKVYLPKRGWQPTPRHIIQVHIYAWLWASQPESADYAPLRSWRIVYLDQKGCQSFGGKLRQLVGVHDYISDRLKLWADNRGNWEGLPKCENPYCAVCQKGGL